MMTELDNLWENRPHLVRTICQGNTIVKKWFDDFKVEGDRLNEFEKKYVSEVIESPDKERPLRLVLVSEYNELIEKLEAIRRILDRPKSKATPQYEYAHKLDEIEEVFGDG